MANVTSGPSRENPTGTVSFSTAGGVPFQSTSVCKNGVVLNEAGEARVDLPEWAEALNDDFRHQLTCIGGVAQVYVADEVADGHFRIAWWPWRG